MFNMSVTSPLAVLIRKTQTGLSTWTFSDSDGFTAVSSAGKVITCASVEELRTLYRKFTGWGFKKRSPLKPAVVSAPAPVVYSAPRVSDAECQRIADLYLND